MKSPLPIAALLAAVAWTAAAAPALPDGEGKELVQTHCTSCHGLSKVTSEIQTEEGWATVVSNMVSAGTVLTDAEFDTIVKYLAKNFGPKKESQFSPRAIQAGGRLTF